MRDESVEIVDISVSSPSVPLPPSPINNVDFRPSGTSFTTNNNDSGMGGFTAFESRLKQLC